MKISQAAPQIPGQNILKAIDDINQAIYNALASDPIIGPLAKAIPPPPKVSALIVQQTQQLKLPQLPPLPPLVAPTPQQKPAAQQLARTETELIVSPFT